METERGSYKLDDSIKEGRDESHVCSICERVRARMYLCMSVRLRHYILLDVSIQTHWFPAEEKYGDLNGVSIFFTTTHVYSAHNMCW